MTFKNETSAFQTLMLNGIMHAIWQLLWSIVQDLLSLSYFAEDYGSGLFTIHASICIETIA